MNVMIKTIGECELYLPIKMMMKKLSCYLV